MTPEKKKHEICPLSHAKKMRHPLRMMVHNPRLMFKKYVKRGDIIIDFGCGPGTFTLALAKLTGPEGLVYAIDIQQGMLDILADRIKKTSLENIHTVMSTSKGTGLDTAADLIVAFYVVHEVPDLMQFFHEMHSLLKPGGILYIAEPSRKYGAGEFEEVIKDSESTGFIFQSRPKVAGSLALVLKRAAD